MSQIEKESLIVDVMLIVRRPTVVKELKIVELAAESLPERIGFQLRNQHLYNGLALCGLQPQSVRYCDVPKPSAVEEAIGESSDSVCY